MAGMAISRIMANCDRIPTDIRMGPVKIGVHTFKGVVLSTPILIVEEKNI
jgi:hypothetical protein